MTTHGAPRDTLFSLSSGPEVSRTDARPLARRSDPITSHEAARDIAPHLSTIQQRVMDFLRGRGGSTATELATQMGYGDPRKVNRRLTELVRDGRVTVGATRPCRVTGARVQTYWVAEEVR